MVGDGETFLAGKWLRRFFVCQEVSYRKALSHFFMELIS